MYIRQAHKKQSSIQHPSTSLHLMQISKFIEQYLHSQQKYLINLSASSIQTHLPIKAQNQHSFDIDLHVPYIESQHYDSNATFTEQHKMHSEIDDQNFTDREGFNSVSIEQEEPFFQQRKVTQVQDEKIDAQTFKFIKNNKKSKSSSFVQSININSSLPFSSTKQSQSQQIKVLALTSQQQQPQLQHLQQTAYFLQQRQKVDRKLLYSTESHHNNQNISYMNHQSEFVISNKSVISKKAIFLNKIQKQKSRKEIAQAINRQRHHIKKFLK